jgi:hypothetical protein
MTDEDATCVFPFFDEPPFEDGTAGGAMGVSLEAASTQAFFDFLADAEPLPSSALCLRFLPSVLGVSSGGAGAISTSSSPSDDASTSVFPEGTGGSPAGWKRDFSPSGWFRGGFWVFSNVTRFCSSNRNTFLKLTVQSIERFTDKVSGD